MTPVDPLLQSDFRHGAHVDRGRGRTHFEVLDGLRGVAAYCVLLVHCFSREWVPNGFLGVDLFFMLSGFVIAHSYRQRLLDGMRMGEFLRRRFVRLYPMVFIGVLLGLAAAGVHNFFNAQEAYAAEALVKVTVFSLLGIPYLVTNPFENAIYPLNSVLWSLFFELLANVFYARFVNFLSGAVLALFACSGLAAMVLIGPIGGGQVSDFLHGFPRVAFGFFAGALIHHAWRTGRLPRWRMGLLPLAAVLSVIVNLPGQIQGAAFLPVAALFVCIVTLAVNAVPRGRERRLCAFLGLISYPMYLLHRPILYFATGIGNRLGATGEWGYLGIVVVTVLVSTLLSYGVARRVELPARTWLSRRLLSRVASSSSSVVA